MAMQATPVRGARAQVARGSKRCGSSSALHRVHQQPQRGRVLVAAKSAGSGDAGDEGDLVSKGKALLRWIDEAMSKDLSDFLGYFYGANNVPEGGVPSPADVEKATPKGSKGGSSSNNNKRGGNGNKNGSGGGPSIPFLRK